MRERLVGLGDLRSKLATYMREVEAGTTITVTNRRRQVARIIPATDASENTLAALRATGTVIWSGRPLKKAKPGVRVRDAGSLSDIVLVNRE